MDESDLGLRNYIYHRFVETGRAPRTAWRPRTLDQNQVMLERLA